jgi:hypothetical protein
MEPGEACDEDRIAELIRRRCLLQGTPLHGWQDTALRTVHQHRLVRWDHVLQSATSDGKTIIAYGKIITRYFTEYLSMHKAVYAVPYRRLTQEKGAELHGVFERIRGRPPRANEIGAVEGTRPKPGHHPNTHGRRNLRAHPLVFRVCQGHG